MKLHTYIFVALIFFGTKTSSQTPLPYYTGLLKIVNKNGTDVKKFIKDN